MVLVRDRRLNLTVKDADVSRLLPFLARQGRFNVILHPSVRGRVTLHLENVSLSAAFMAIVANQNLVAMLEQNIVVVMPRAIYLKRLQTMVRTRRLMQRVVFMQAPRFR